MTRPQPPAHAPAPDRRAFARRLSGRVATARPDGEEPATALLVTVQRLWASGLDLLSPVPFPPGAVLVVESVQGEGLRPLLARVVHGVRRDDGPLHGCELAQRLGDEEARAWLE